MSVSEIIAELPNLQREDLERVDARLHQLLAAEKSGPATNHKAIGQVLLEFAGQADGLPSDYSANLDHYLYGVPKRQP